MRGETGKHQSIRSWHAVEPSQGVSVTIALGLSSHIPVFPDSIPPATEAGEIVLEERVNARQANS